MKTYLVYVSQVITYSKRFEIEAKNTDELELKLDELMIGLDLTDGNVNNVETSYEDYEEIKPITDKVGN